MALVAGTKLGRCEIQSPVGAGGMGEVYRASDGRLGREVALKVLPSAFASVLSAGREFPWKAAKPARAFIGRFGLPMENKWHTGTT